MLNILELDAPTSSNRYIQMFWTVERIGKGSVNGVFVKWNFPSDLEKRRALAYFRNGFKFADQLELKLDGVGSLLMRYKNENPHVNRPGEGTPVGEAESGSSAASMPVTDGAVQRNPERGTDPVPTSPEVDPDPPAA